MASKTVRSWGTWPSPITPEVLSEGNVDFDEVAVNVSSDTVNVQRSVRLTPNKERTGQVYWIETRPHEDGRRAIVQYSEATGVRDVLPSKYSAHASVQDLGGATIGIDVSGNLIFWEEWSQQIYKLNPDSQEVTQLTTSAKLTRYAAFAVHPGSSLIVAVKEDHNGAKPTTQAYGVRNSLVVLDAKSGSERVLAEGDDFYAYPSFSPDGRHLFWVQWSHPDMPWTGTRLFVADWVDGKAENIKHIAGEKLNESVTQPKWSGNDSIFFASDRSGYWQLYQCHVDARFVKKVPAQGLEKCEFAVADWTLGNSSYAILSEKEAVATCVENGESRVVLLDLQTGHHEDLHLPFFDLGEDPNCLHRLDSDSVVIMGSGQTSPKEVAIVSQIRSKSFVKTLRSGMKNKLGPEFFSIPTHLEIPRSLRSGHVHAFHFPPKHPEFQGPSDSPPPALIYVHGGPNGCTPPCLDLELQAWTTRGYAVTAVNYSGSTGHGREYREELTGSWGLYDVHDTADAVRYLVSKGLANGSRIGIFGGSAGGYLTLTSITMFPDLFAAAVSNYGISDIRALQADTYKFESHDVQRLALSCPEEDTEGRDRLFHQRSPRFFAAQIKASLLLLQGLEDTVVPPEQARIMVKEIEQQGRTVKLVEFEGEGHGWIKGSTILRAYQEQEKWWKKYLCDQE